MLHVQALMLVGIFCLRQPLIQDSCKKWAVYIRSHFVGMFLKVPTLEEFNIATGLYKSALSAPEKWKVDVIGYSFAYIFQARIIFIFSHSIVYRITMRIFRHIKTVTKT